MAFTLPRVAGRARPLEAGDPGGPFYDGTVYHRVVPGHVIQTGVPQSDRAKNPGYNFPNGFDVLRDRLAVRLGEQVHRPFAAAVIDEADSILIDEARIPLVI